VCARARAAPLQILNLQRLLNAEKDVLARAIVGT